MKEISKAWYLVCTKPKNEPLVNTRLNMENIKVLYPRIQDFKWKGGKVVPSVKPLFPGYVFVYISLSSDYYKVKWTHGVNRFISFGDFPMPIDDQLIDFLKSKLGEEGLIKRKRLKRGDKIKVNIGPFKGLIGIIENDVPPSGRVKVLMDALKFQCTFQLSDVLLECFG